MKSAWCLVLLAAAAVAAPKPVGAADLVLPFLRGLRAQGLYDIADEYLDRLAKDPNVSADVKKRIPYERAVTLTEEAFTGKNAELQLRLLDRAASELDKFIRDNPGHPLLGDAKTRRGNIFLGKARAYTLQAQSPSNAAERDKFHGLAQSSIDTARKVFESARIDHEKRWKTFPVFTPDPTIKKQREHAEKDYIQAQIDLAKTTYEEAQIHPRTDAKFKAILTKASKQFEAIHTRYRTQLGGLLARVHQGKCFEEQNEIGRALGIYNEFLDHPKTPEMAHLQNQVLHFRLICLNHDSRKDYQLIETEASAWLARNRRLQRTATGLGIRYQLAIAREKLADKSGTPAKDRQRLQRDAQRDAEFVNAFPGRYKDVTTLMISRLKRARGLKTKDPDTFPDAYSTALVSFSAVKGTQNAIQKAKADGKPKREIDDLAGKLKEHVDESTRLFRLTLTLANPTKDKLEHINTARHLLGFLYYLQSDLYRKDDLLFDAAVLAEYVARNFKNQSPDMARDCAFLAMACYGRIHSLAPPGNRDTEMQWIIRSALFITENWPGSKRAIDAIDRLGDIYEQQNRPLLAARWYSRIPPSARNRYSFALLRTGQSYWAHYLSVAAQEPNRRNQFDALRQSVGGEWPLAVADLLNPSWTDLDRLRKQQELAAKLSGGPAPKAKQPQPKGKTKAKIKAKAAAPSKAVADALAKSTAELQKALPELTKLTAEQLRARSHDELRTLLISTLRKQTRTDLKARFEKQLAELSDNDLMDTLQRKIELWQVLAAWHLKAGVDTLQGETPKNASPPDELIAGKLSLAQYLIGIGEYDRVIALLNDGPHGVIAAIKVADESKRPDRGITSRRFAGLAYQVLARAYIGIRKLDEFRKAMESLKAIAGGDDKENVTRIYEQLGRDLQREFELLKNQGQDKRLNEERENFRWIVRELFKNKADLKYNSLIWIAETSYGMGEGLGDDGQAKDYFKQAADAYQQILESTKDKDQRLGVQLRLANCRRRQQEYEQALEIAESVIKEKPRFLRAQVEAALALQAWGASGKSDKFLIAINGDETRNLWGWSGIASKILQSPDFPRTSDSTRWTESQMEFKQKYLQAQYYTSWSRMQHGMGQNAEKKDPRRVQVLSNAMRQLIAFSSSCGVIDGLTFIDEATRKPVDAKKTFDQLFRDVQLEMGKSLDQLLTITWPVRTNDPEPRPVIAKNGRKGDEQPLAKTAPETAKAQETKREDSGSGPLAMIFGLTVLIGGLGGAGWMIYRMSRKGGRRVPSYADYALGGSPFAAPSPSQSNTARPAAQKPRSAAPRPSDGQQPAATQPARAKPAAGAAKPRTAPPTTPKKPG